MLLLIFLIVVGFYIYHFIKKNSRPADETHFIFGMIYSMAIVFAYVILTGAILGETNKHNVLLIESPETGYLIEQWDQTCKHPNLSNWLIFNYCGKGSIGPRAKILTWSNDSNSDPITID